MVKKMIREIIEGVSFEPHHSEFEKYARMLKELEAAEGELRECRRLLEHMWGACKWCHATQAEEHAFRVAHAAERAALECIQLAAVARNGIG